jgi:hypothetical protein
MKNLILCFAFLAIASNSWAEVEMKAEMQAKSFEDLRIELKRTSFTYQETGLVFGFISIQSCLFVSEKFAVFKNYCFPARTYPAKGHTIISKEFGIVELYEEKQQTKNQRVIRISEFPSYLAPYIDGALSDFDLSAFSGIIEKLYYRYNPGCWSTNSAINTGLPEANCSRNPEQVIGLEAWALETQTIVNDESQWELLMSEMKDQFSL